MNSPLSLRSRREIPAATGQGLVLHTAQEQAFRASRRVNSITKNYVTYLEGIRSLDENLKLRRTVEQAVAILSETCMTDKKEAYRRRQDNSQNSQTSIGEIAQAIIATRDL